MEITLEFLSRLFRWRDSSRYPRLQKRRIHMTFIHHRFYILPLINGSLGAFEEKGGDIPSR